MRPQRLALGFCVLLLALAASAAAAPRVVPARVRLADIEAALPEQPAGWGAPATDRVRWQQAAATVPTAAVLASAREAARQPHPVLTDALYRRYSRDGNRTEFQEANLRRLRRLNLFAWAEALEHQGHFVGPLQAAIAELLAEPTWVLPAHDPKLNNLEGRWTEIDLMVAMKGWMLATALYWHEASLDPIVVQRARAELDRRLFQPFLAAARGGANTDGMWWLQADNNWNAVCHAGIVGAALAVLPARAERATIVGFAELNLEHYLKGFTPDGYCSEGIGYWNYGFGHFAMMSDTLARATGGRVRPLAGDHALRVAAYPWAVQILPGVYPAYADMDVRERPSTWFGALAVMQVYPKPLGMKSWNLAAEDLRTLMLYESAMKVFLPLVTAGLPAAPAPRPSGQHHWFADAQVYTGRATATFGGAIKGGHNAEHHNHNDLGSFVIAAGDRAVLADPGLETYTARTFGPNRYDSLVLGSYGHAVPRVAGRLQSAGREYAAKVISTRFTETEDQVVLDLKGAYDVPELTSLVRTFTLRRSPRPEIVIADEVVFASPAAFETALVTFERWKERKPGRLRVGEGAATVHVEIDADQPWVLRPEVLEEDLPGGRKPTRLGLAAKGAVTTARFTITIRPD